MGSQAGSEGDDPVAAFMRAASVPLDDWHGAGTLAAAQAILASHPQAAISTIHAAALVGDQVRVRRFLVLQPGLATIKGGPHDWDPLTYLCFSRYLRLDRARSSGFVQAATALLDAGASPNTGFYEHQHHDRPQFESVLYGAAGVAQHPQLTSLLLERGADPNDGETAYHAPETLDDRALRAIVLSGKLEAEGLTTMLHRKLDWHHHEGAAWLLAHGADPNRPNHPWQCSSAIHHALGRCNRLRYFQLLLDHGGDPTLPALYGPSAPAIAARRGRADVLDLFRQRGFDYTLAGDDAFLEACARADQARVAELLAAQPGIVARLQAQDPAVLAEFAGAGNVPGTSLLLDLGFAISSRTGRGGARGDTALHVAVWRERLDMVKLLIDRGVPLEATNGRGETALELAVRALVEQSDWTPHGSTEILATLLQAGARVDSVKRFPSGSPAADDLLRRHGKRS